MPTSRGSSRLSRLRLPSLACVRRARPACQSQRAAVVEGAPRSARGPDGMSPPVTRPVSRVDIHQSRQLIHDSRVLIAAATELIRQSRWTISQQTYRKIVCAWCQQTIRWERAEGATWGQMSHSSCFACFAPVFRELDPVNTPFRSLHLRE
jgi:hypothetical protein